MATIEVRQPPVKATIGDIMSDEQIDELLQQAEARLREKAGLQIQKIEGKEKRIAIPKLQHGMDKSSYISEKNGVARVDPNLLVKKDDNKMADGLRSIEAKGKSKAVVSFIISLLFSVTIMRKIFPKTFLDADQQFILNLPCFHEIY